MEENKRIGRPTDYNEKLHPILAESLAQQGFIDTEIAEKMDIDVSTFYRWKRLYPDFCESIKKGKESIDDLIEDSLFRKAKGYTIKLKKPMTVNDGKESGSHIEEVEYDAHFPGDTTAMIFWLKNRRPKEWREKQDDVLGNEATLNINVKSVVDNSNVEIHSNK